MSTSLEMARRDGVRISRHGEYLTFIKYHPICRNCGNECNVTAYISGNEYTCAQCNNAQKFFQKEERQNRMMDRAVKKIRSFNIHKSVLQEYEQCIEVIKKKLKSGMKLDSKEEAMVAIQLEKDGISYETQVSIADHKVDFILRDLRMIIEVDGGLYHVDEERDQVIDERITEELGSDWEIIRISDDYVNDYITAIGSAILRIYEICESEDQLFDKSLIPEIILKEFYGPIFD